MSCDHAVVRMVRSVSLPKSFEDSFVKVEQLKLEQKQVEADLTLQLQEAELANETKVIQVHYRQVIDCGRQTVTQVHTSTVQRRYGHWRGHRHGHRHGHGHRHERWLAVCISYSQMLCTLQPRSNSRL